MRVLRTILDTPLIDPGTLRNRLSRLDCLKVNGWRILLWFATAFLVLGVFLPEIETDVARRAFGERFEGTRTVQMCVAHNDPRGFRDDIPGEAHDSDITIAWVGSSSLIVVDPSLGKDSSGEWVRSRVIPHEVAGRIEAVSGKKVATLLYLRRGMPLYDFYLCMRDALSRRPDRIVLTLNPLTMLNNRPVTKCRNLYTGTLVRQTLSPRDFWHLLKFARPVQFVWAGLSHCHSVVKYRNGYHEQYVEPVRHTWQAWLKDQRHLLVVSDPKQRQFNYSQPARFWLEQGVWGGQRGLVLHRLHAAQLCMAREPASTLNGVVLDMMFQCIVDADIPAFVYVSPVDKGVYDNEILRERIELIERTMRHYAMKYGSADVQIIERNLSNMVGPQKFKDFVHLLDHRNITEYLAARLLQGAGSESAE
jgi:hypothetical protein